MLKQILRNLVKGPATMDGPAAAPGAAEELASRLDRLAHVRLGRSLAIRHVDAGSCNGCELEIHALSNPVYDVERFGVRFVASPRHADVLLVTGPVTHNMREALWRTWQATPNPKWVVACGGCALDGGIFRGAHGVVGGVDQVVPVHLRVPGCPPRPVDLLAALVALLERADRPPPLAAGVPGEQGRADVAQEAVEAPRIAGEVVLHDADGARQ